MDAERRLLLELYRSALDAVAGDKAVGRYLRAHPPEGPVHIAAVGKAAVAMARGAVETLGANLRSGLVITKHGHASGLFDPRVQVMESAHPVPDASSLAAGDRLLAFLDALPEGEPLLFLVSGGTSALAEKLPEGLGEETLKRLTDWLLGSGLPIDAVNRVRKGVSLLKGGRLALRLRGRPTLNLMISDVPGDDPRVIGSGLLVPHPPDALSREGLDLPSWVTDILDRGEPAPVPDDPVYCNVHTAIIGCNAEGRAAAAALAREKGLAVHDHPDRLEGEAVPLGERIARDLAGGPAGLHLWGGEPTVTLPTEPGRGGRAQALALSAARALTGHGECCLLAAGSDGTDGPTEDAGALVDSGTLARGCDEGLDPDDHLRRADAGTFLEASGDLVQTGPTGTNVMDWVFGLRR